MRRKPSKDNNMSGSNPCTGQYSNNTLNNHRHIDNNSIPNPNLKIISQPSCEILHSPMKLPIGNTRFLHKNPPYPASNGTLDKVGNLIWPILEMHIKTLFGDIDLPIWKPSIEMKIINPQSSLGKHIPLHPLRLLLPISQGINQCSFKCSLIGPKPITQPPGNHSK